jgi:uncharacterized protein YdiU (UPF0061 family)
MQIPFDNSYVKLPARFFARVSPTQVPAPRLIHLNDALAQELGLDAALLRSESGVQMLAGNFIPAGAEPLAMAYAGHQFGNWVPQLGDGRAVLLGEVIDVNGVRRDIQLKGAGRTPFSRSGDGRAVLGPTLREYLVSEAMAALGIPTTRALAVTLTGDQVLRQGLQPGAVFTRVARGHVRIGTFEFFANRGDDEGVKTLADYVIARHYAEAAGAPQPYLALLQAVSARTADLIARWQLVGFIHGVMNTDNMSIAGETIDYGPCAFMDTYHPDTVYSSIDTAGRYAYSNQPRIAQWNLARFAQALLPLLAPEESAAIELAQAALNAFVDRFQDAWLRGMRDKLGLAQPLAGDDALAQDLLTCMTQQRADFTLTFRRLADWAGDSTPADSLRRLFADPLPFDAWSLRWRTRLAVEGRDLAAVRADMYACNPAFIPRNHRIEEVIQAAQRNDDFKPFQTLLNVLSAPYEDRPEFAPYATPPQPHEIIQATFCGT